jgi:hypothetical protein
MKQPLIAPATMGASIVAGVAAMLVGGYKIADCLRYQAGPSACDQVVEANAITIVGGFAAIAGPFGGLFTYNDSLEPPGSTRRRRLGSSGDSSGSGPGLAVLEPIDLALIDSDPRVTFQLDEPAPPQEPAPPAAAAPLLQDPWLDEGGIEARINELSESGWSQQGIAELLGVTLYRVRKALGRL